MWPIYFTALRYHLEEGLGDLAVAIVHVGSTAVRGLAAKPIIDLDVVIGTLADFTGVSERLTTLGYQHVGDLGIVGREAFRQPTGLPRHHLYVCAQDSVQLGRHLAFRDYLRSHADVAGAYASLKQELARRFRDERDGYTDAKSDFVESVLAQAFEMERPLSELALPRSGAAATG